MCRWLALVSLLLACGPRPTTQATPSAPMPSVAPAPPPPPPKPAPTVWNTSYSLGKGAWHKLTVFGPHPNTLFPACRCIAGTWRHRGENATHFTGSLAVSSVNFPAKLASVDAKVRKTRRLMGVAPAHRPALHDIMRGTGSLILREVEGGEYEVVAYGPDPLGNVFATNARWRSDPSAPPRPAPATPIIDPAADALALAKLINDYRASLHLPRVPLSRSLTKVAQTHVGDLNVNKPVSDACNMHSWSTAGKWSACCYDKSPAAARCMWSKPSELSSYRGNGYEIAAFASGITPEQALVLWQQSPAHHEVMVNAGKWNVQWGAMGVAIDGDYATAWFGEDAE